VEKLRGDKNADFGLVDAYGLLLGARFLVPKGELGVNETDFKISNQRAILKDGGRPLPIYTAVRHEIAKTDIASEPGTNNYEKDVERAKEESWFQWFEITPYEVFCEEIGAGIPTWAMGRRFKDGQDVPLDHGFHLPEIRTPLLMGIFGSAFCATLSHYYKEIRPLVRSISGLATIDDMINQRDDEMAKIHPIDPAIIPNYAYQMYGKLPPTATRSIYENEHMQLMDAGMSNNLPIYPLLRPGRDVDILVSFDASADIRTDNWLSVADGYARQRGVKGWPIGIGWPKEGEPVSQAKKELQDAEAHSTREAEEKVQQAKKDQRTNRDTEGQSKEDDSTKFEAERKQDSDLGYCTVWVGTTAERTTSEAPPPTKPVSDQEAWRLMADDAGLAVIYLPLLTNPKVPGVSPGETDFLSTWNFVYTPDQIESVVELARANYDEGKRQIQSTVRAVYERKRQMRLNKERELNMENQTQMTDRRQDQLLD
jgi:phospholipase A2